MAKRAMLTAVCLTVGCLFVLLLVTSGPADAQPYQIVRAFDNLRGPNTTLLRDASGNLYGTTPGTVFKVAPDGALTVLHRFSASEGSPYANLVRDGGGNLYGSTSGGGATPTGSHLGTIFKLAPDGTYTVLYLLDPGFGGPASGLVLDGSGNLYGTTEFGGNVAPFSDGTVFKLTPGGMFTVLHRFAEIDGSNPSGALVRDADGNLYGTTRNGGSSDPLSSRGTVYKVAPAGSHTVLHRFSGSDGAAPLSGVILDGSGNLYGTTYHGPLGSGFGLGAGTVFRIAAGGTHTILHAFAGNDGERPSALVRDASGNLYGTTEEGGAGFEGTVFKISADGTHSILHGFSGSDGSMPLAGVSLDASTGDLYGTTSSGGVLHPHVFPGPGTVFKVTAGGTHGVVYSFARPEGFAPFGFALDPAGNVYGTTSEGGPSGGGAIFKHAADGTGTTLHTFAWSDGGSPFGDLFVDDSGEIYGTTPYGGSSSEPFSGAGTVFRLAADGSHSILHAFDGVDGGFPYAGVIRDGSGTLYGATFASVFKLAPDGTHTVVQSFDDGSTPSGRLVFDGSGNLYGTTQTGGSFGSGSVFKLTADDTLTVLHSFTGGDDGLLPFAGVVFDTSGNLYGTTIAGGASGYGTVFKLAPDGALAILHSFTGGSDGTLPYGALAVDGSGNIYGTTYYGGAPSPDPFSGPGTVFKIATDGTHTVIHTFTESDGTGPSARVVLDGNGYLYGTTQLGGPRGGGVVFRMSLDADADGILDPVDTNAAVASNDFSDVPRGGTTTGAIVMRGPVMLTIADAPAPAGVRITASSGGVPIPTQVSVCGGSALLSFFGGEDVVVTCGSVTVRVFHGPVEIRYTSASGATATTSLGAGNTLTFEPATFTFTATATNASSVVVLVAGGSLAVAPGATVTVQATITVMIDIKPGSERNTINPREKGNVTVAVLGTPTFDPRTIDPATVRFGPGGAPALKPKARDADHDRNGDGVFRFDVARTGITCDQTSVTLTGQTRSGVAFQGSDRITTVGCKDH